MMKVNQVPFLVMVTKLIQHRTGYMIKTMGKKAESFMNALDRVL